MFAISFIFRPGTYDDEFRRLDAATQAVADATEGYLGTETWWSDDRTVCNVVYYWADLARLSDFAQATTHRAAKAVYDRWYDGYQVVVAEVRGAYGDGRLPHLTSPIATIRRPLCKLEPEDGGGRMREPMLSTEFILGPSGARGVQLPQVLGDSNTHRSAVAPVDLGPDSPV